MADKQRLTEKIVRAAALRVKGYRIVDSEVPGFAAVIYPSGYRAFSLTYRAQGRRRYYTIGGWPAWNCTAARERAKELRRMIEAGGDPLSQREEDRAAAKMPELIDLYIRTHLPQLTSERHRKDQESMLRNLVEPEWRRMLVAEITPTDVAKLLDRIAQGRARPARARPKRKRRRPLGPPRPTPVRANRCGEIVRKMFNEAIRLKMRADNPALGFKRRPENERDRFLSRAEFKVLSDALAASEDERSAAIIRMCALTGARLGEVRCARFDQFDLELMVWSKPAATVKQRRIHRLPISPATAALVRLRREAVPKGTSWLFPGDAPLAPGEKERQPVQEIRRFWRSIQKATDLHDVRINDLRHTFASMLVSGGMSLEMIGKLLGHSQIKTTQRYAHLMDSPLRAGVNHVGDMMQPRLRVVENDPFCPGHKP